MGETVRANGYNYSLAELNKNATSGGALDAKKKRGGGFLMADSSKTRLASGKKDRCAKAQQGLPRETGLARNLETEKSFLGERNGRGR